MTTFFLERKVITGKMERHKRKRGKDERKAEKLKRKETKKTKNETESAVGYLERYASPLALEMGLWNTFKTEVLIYFSLATRGSQCYR